MLDGRYRSGIIARDMGPYGPSIYNILSPPPQILNFVKHKVAIGIRYSDVFCLGTCTGTRYSSGSLWSAVRIIRSLSGVRIRSAVVDCESCGKR